MKLLKMFMSDNWK